MFSVKLDRVFKIPGSLSDTGIANFIIGSAKLCNHDVEPTDPKDRKHAEVLLFYGDWTAEGPFALMDGNQIAILEAFLVGAWRNPRSC